MPDIKGVLQDEIKRLAKREIKAATAPLQKTIMELKRKVAVLERTLAVSEKESAKEKITAAASAEKAVETEAKPAKGKKSRFSGKTHKKRTRSVKSSTVCSWIQSLVPWRLRR